MRIFGLEITRSKTEKQDSGGLSPVWNSGGWWPIVRESFPGAWQQGVTVRRDLVLAYFAVYACITRIAGDIGKLRPKLMSSSTPGSVPVEVTSPSFSPLLRRPNRYQTWQKFIESWMVSKLIHGNAYVYKVYDNRGVVVEMHVLDAQRVRALVATNGDVYYQVGSDDLAQLQSFDPTNYLPARLIIHDTMITLFHPLMGVSPIFACGLASMQGLAIQNNSAKFFQNMSRPSGVLTAPGQIKDETAKRLKTYWEEEFSADKIGKVAVLGDGLKYEPMVMTASDAQLIDQLKWTADMVCSVFHVPGYMVGVGPAPSYNNVAALNQQYYSQCLQVQIESIEAHLDHGLQLSAEVGKKMFIELDLDDLIRTDVATQVDLLVKATGSPIMMPNEARAKRNLPPVDGGDTIYMQQQNFSIAALADRDRNDPFAKPPPAPPPAPAASADDDSLDEDLDEDLDENEDITEEEERAVRFMLKGFFASNPVSVTE